MGFLSGITGAAGGIGGANVLIGADTRMLRGQVREGMRQVKGELEAGAANAERTASRWNSAFGAIGTAMKVGMLGAVAALGAGIGAAIQFESAWAGVRKTVEATPAELGKLRQAFRDLALEIPVSVNELAAIGETGGAMGIAKESLVEFTKVVATIGQTTNVTTDAAATALGQLSNVLHLTDEDYSRFAATLVDLGNKGASTESQILEMAARAGSAAGLVGIAAKDVLAYASATASLGIEVEAGGTSLQSFFLKANAIVGAGSGITKAAKDAGMSVEKFVGIVMKGGKGLTQLADATGLTTKKLKELVTSSSQLEVMARVAGMTGEAFAQAFEKDAAGALQVFLAGLGRLKGAEQQGVLKDLKLGDVRMTRTLLGLANGADLLADNLDNAAAAWDANTAATEEAEKRYETTAAQLGLLKNLIQDYLITLGDAALPAVKGLLAALRDDLPKAITFLANIWTTTLYPAVSGMLGAFGELGHSIGLLFGQKDEAANWGSVMGTVATGAANGLAAVAKAIGAIVTGISWLLRNPIGGFVAKLVALAVAFKAITSGFGALRGSLTASSQGLLRSIGLGGLMPSSSSALKGDPALNASAGKLDAAAAHLERAAGAIGRGGVAGVPNTAGPGMRPSPTGTGAFIDASGAYRGTEQAVAAEIALRARMKAAEDAAKRAGQNMVQRVAGDIVGGIRSGAGKLKDGALKGLGMVGNLFWPVMIAGVATEIIKAPLGDFVIGNTQFKRAGAKIKEDFFGGLLALVEAANVGSDVFLALPEVAFGKNILNTKSLGANANSLSEEDIARLASGGLTGIQAASELSPELTAGMMRMADESVIEWYQRVKDNLGAANTEAMKSMAAKLSRAPGRGGGLFGAAKDAVSTELAAALETSVSGFASESVKGARDALRTGVIAAVQNATAGKVSLTTLTSLPQSVYDDLADLLIRQATGLDPRVFALTLSGLIDSASDKPVIPGLYAPSGRGGDTTTTPLTRERADLAERQRRLIEQRNALSPELQAQLDEFAQTLDASGNLPTEAAIANALEQLQKVQAKNNADSEGVLTLLETSTKGLEKLTGSKDHQKEQVAGRNALLKKINAMLGLTGENQMNWTDLINWKAELSESTGRTAQRALNKQLKEWSVEAARSGAEGGVEELWHWWGKSIRAADTAEEKEALRVKMNDLLPEADQMDKAEFAQWLNDIIKSANEYAYPGKEVDDAFSRLLPTTSTAKDEQTFAQWLTSTVEHGTTEALSGKLKDDLYGMGTEMVRQVARGIRNARNLVKIAMAVALTGVKSVGPGSPVKEGPLKHPFLPEFGAAIAGQVADGLQSTASQTRVKNAMATTLRGINAGMAPLKMPSMTGTSINGMKLAGAGAGALTPPPGQVLNVDRLQMFGASDEKSILQRTRFMAPSGRR